MIKDIDSNLEKFLKTYPCRVCVDINEVKDFNACYDLAKKYGVDFGLFICDKKEIKHAVDFFVVMGVFPGESGQSLKDDVFDLIDYYSMYNVLVGVDGGINDSNILNFKDKKLDFIYSGSMIFKANNPLQKFNKTQELLK
jgi:pentose-5-phosphate-3-epimerase